ncbi:MAG: amidohydrolase, partial [Gemmatimonadota bacterium]|nr:amidohydrolase [Gemmatimonadota bacterium]
MFRTRVLSNVMCSLLVAATVAPAPASGYQETAPTQEKPKDRSKQPLPLEGWAENRSLSLDLTEGTWMSVDVSPDGNTLVFDYLGDLYTLPISGGDATRLTRGMAFDAQPRFSPDGSRVAFTSDRDGGQNIWILSLDGTDTVQVSKGKSNRAESPEWTPDGEYVVASMGDFRGSHLPVLQIFHTEGGSGAKLFRGENERKTVGAAFGPDGRYVWFARRTGARDWDYNAQLPMYQLAVYDRDTGHSYERSSRYGGGFRPTLSPDGRRLVYGTRHDEHTGLVIRNLETGREQWLAYPVQRDDQESRGALDVLPGMSFTPDGASLVASYGGKLWRIPVEGGDAVEIPFRVRAELELGAEVDFDYPIEDTPTFTVRQIRDAVPSPDGARIAFTALDRLWVANADGSGPRELAADLEEGATVAFPTWSPDGAWVAVATWKDGHGTLTKVRVRDGRTVRLTPSSGNVYVTPSWAPDGTRIVAIQGPAHDFDENTGPRGAAGATRELVWIPADGGNPTVIAPLDGRGSPHFTQDPERIFLFSGSDGLVSIRWDGTDQKAHVKVRGETPAGSTQAMNASVILMAPRGDQALAVVNRQIYAVTVPRLGGDAPTISVSDPDKAQFPARKLTDMGGEFPAWSANGRRVHWSLGNAHFVYDLDAAAAYDDSVTAASEGEGEKADSATAAGADEYSPTEVRVVIAAPRDIPRGVAVLRGARVVTMKGDEVIERGDVVVRDNRIEAVGAQGSVTIPEGAEIIDMAGRTIVPGFVDTHSHMWPAWDLHRPDQWIYMANLAYGVTTTRDPQTATTDVLTYEDLVRTGEILGPRIYSTGPGVFWQENIRSLDHAR